MIRQIVPVFFTTEIPHTLAFYKDKLGFECLGTWLDPPVYAIANFLLFDLVDHFAPAPVLPTFLRSASPERAFMRQASIVRRM